MKYDLKPCPFCGGTACFGTKDVPRVVCGTCGVQSAYYRTNKQAAVSWNTRASSPEREALVKCMDALKTIHEFPITHLIENQDATNMALIAGEALAQAKQALGEGETKFDDPQFATSLEELEELIWSRAEILRLNVSLNRLRDQIADPETVTITRNRYEQYQRAEAELTLERKKLEDLLKGENK